MVEPIGVRREVARRSSWRVALALGLLGSTSGAAWGQGFVLAEFDGSQGTNRLGWSVASAGDIDGDGVADLLLGAVRRFGPHGRVNVISGATGALLLGLTTTGWADDFGTAVASAGDVNGDGVPDVLVGARLAGSVTLFSGADGALLFTVLGSSWSDLLGTSVASAGDVNGDGVPDVIAGAPTASPGSLIDAGEARVFSGVDRTLLRVFSGAAQGDRLGTSVSGVGDVSGDGLGDVVVGAPYANANFWPEGGVAQVYSGGSGALLLAVSASMIGNAHLGESVAGIGDLEGDGVPDLLVGAPDASVTLPTLSEPGQLRAYSGATGGLLLTLTGVPDEHMGQSVASAGDVDQDGVPDLLSGAPHAPYPSAAYDSGSARVFSGAAGILLYAFAGTFTNENFGWSVAGVGDLDGDGASEFLVGAPYAGLGTLGAADGRVTLYSGATGLARSVFDGTAHGARAGFSLAGVGDLDGDGVPDAIAGSPFARVGTLSEAGRARVLSGANGSVLLELTGSGAEDQFGWAVAGAGDVNGDGVPDVIVGTPFPDPGGLANAGRVEVLSGANGGTIFTVDGTAPYEGLGSSVCRAGDLNGDGIPDLVVGAPGVNGSSVLGAGAARVLSGANGAAILVVTGTAYGHLATSVADVGDVDGDGVPDFVAGAPYASPGGLSLAGEAKVFSGASGALLLSMEGTAPNEAWGSSVAGVDDLNGDGVPDVLVGAPRESPGIPQPGQAKVFSGADGTVLRTFVGTPADQLGKSVANAGDVDGDGIPDVAIGAPSTAVGGQLDAGAVKIFSGASGTLLSTLPGALFGDLFGTCVAGGGDRNGDGIPDPVVSAPYADPGGLDEAGQVRFLTVVGVPPGAARFGSGCAGTGGAAPIIAAFGGAPAVGNSAFGLAVTQGLGGAPALLFLGTLPNPAGISIGGCAVFLAGAILAIPPPAFLSGAFGSGGAGHRLQNFPVPGDPALVGLTVHFQWGILDLGSPNGLFAISDALSVTVL